MNGFGDDIKKAFRRATFVVCFLLVALAIVAFVFGRYTG